MPSTPERPGSTPGEQTGGEPWTSPLQGRRPPPSPTDEHPRGIVVGTVLEHSSGPCYRVRTDDGVVAELHGGRGEVVTSGQVVRAVLDLTPEGHAAAPCCPGSGHALIRIHPV